MKIVTVISDPNYPGYLQMLRSANKFGIEVIALQKPVIWGLQQRWIYEWAKESTEKGQMFMYLDGYDTVFLAGTDEIISKLPDCKMFLHGERVCFPDVSIEHRYPQNESPWRFVNGGGFITSTDYYAALYENEHRENVNDQGWLSETFLKYPADVKIDHKCEIFQALAPIVLGTIIQKKGEKRIINTITGSMPVVVHGNGGVDMTWVYENLI